MPMAILRYASGHREYGEFTARAVIYGGPRGVRAGPPANTEFAPQQRRFMVGPGDHR
jgi:hypothetical protein